MNKNEKIYIMNQCIEHLEKALEKQLTNPYLFFMYVGSSQTLKKFIEKYIDCQSNPFYKKYQYIVKLTNQLGVTKW